MLMAGFTGSSKSGDGERSRGVQKHHRRRKNNASQKSSKWDKNKEVSGGGDKIYLMFMSLML